MSLYKRVPGLAALAVVSICGPVLVGGQAQAGDGRSVTVNVVNPETDESPRPATLSASAHCDDEATGTWSVSWSFSAMRDGNDVVILGSSLPVEAWPAGAHLMPAGSMPDYSQWPLAQSTATSYHHDDATATETLRFRLLPDGIGQPYNDGTISLTVGNPCAVPEVTSTTAATTTATTAAETTTTTIMATSTTAAEVVDVVTTAATTTTTTKAATTTTAKKTVVADATVQALPKTGSPSSRLAAIASALAAIGFVLMVIDRQRRRA